MEEILFSFLWFVARFFSPMNSFITKEVSAKYWCYLQQLTFLVGKGKANQKNNEKTPSSITSIALFGLFVKIQPMEKQIILIGLILIVFAIFSGLLKLKPKSKTVKVLGGLIIIPLLILYGYWDYQYHCADWIFWWDRIFCNYDYE